MVSRQETTVSPARQVAQGGQTDRDVFDNRSGDHDFLAGRCLFRHLCREIQLGDDWIQLIKGQNGGCDMLINHDNPATISRAGCWLRINPNALRSASSIGCPCSQVIPGAGGREVVGVECDQGTDHVLVNFGIRFLAACQRQELVGQPRQLRGLALQALDGDLPDRTGPSKSCSNRTVRWDFPSARCLLQGVEIAEQHCRPEVVHIGHVDKHEVDLTGQRCATQDRQQVGLARTSGTDDDPAQREASFGLLRS